MENSFNDVVSLKSFCHLSQSMSCSVFKMLIILFERQTDREESFSLPHQPPLSLCETVLPGSCFSLYSLIIQ